MKNTSSSLSQVHVAKSLYSLLGSPKAKLMVGNRQGYANISQVNTSEESQKLPIILKNSGNMRIPPGSYNGGISNNSLWLGPIIGVLTAKKNNFVYPTGEKARIYRELFTYGAKRGVLFYYFYPEGLDKKRQLIEGYTWQKGKWTKGFYPIPDIVYNRILQRSKEKSKKARDVLAWLEKFPGTYLFNSRFLNKWEVYQAVRKHPEAAVFFPPTSLFSYSSLHLFLKDYTSVFLKPIGGSRGEGIIKVIAAKNSFYCSRANPTRIRWIKCASLERLKNQLRKWRVKNGLYIMQGEVKLAQIDGRVFDLRTQMQKNGVGEWEITGAGVRIAAKDRFVTHIPNGGRAAPFEQVVKQAFSAREEMFEEVKAQMRRICSVVPTILEKELKINLAVLTMDLGIDQNGQVRVLEINSKPAVFDETSIKKRHLELLVDYCIFSKTEKMRGNRNES
ncbi:MAG: YheC/YheD family protein [Syntrophomonadaceae bacterium]|jgi:hypothetical protein